MKYLCKECGHIIEADYLHVEYMDEIRTHERSHK